MRDWLAGISLGGIIAGFVWGLLWALAAQLPPEWCAALRYASGWIGAGFGLAVVALNAAAWSGAPPAGRSR